MGNPLISRSGLIPPLVNRSGLSTIIDSYILCVYTGLFITVNDIFDVYAFNYNIK